MAKRGETREKILAAATEMFFTNGYEATSVKMILEKAGIVTGSFYHFFSSKEELFEAVVENFLQSYTDRVSAILNDETLDFHIQLQCFFQELKKSSAVYYDVLQGNKLHWTIEYALHNKTVEMLIAPIARLLDRQLQAGRMESRLQISNDTLAAVIVHGIEAILHSGEDDKHLKIDLLEMKTKEIYDFLGSMLIIHSKEKRQ